MKSYPFKRWYKFTTIRAQYQWSSCSPVENTRYSRNLKSLREILKSITSGEQAVMERVASTRACATFFFPSFPSMIIAGWCEKIMTIRSDVGFLEFSTRRRFAFFVSFSPSGIYLRFFFFDHLKWEKCPSPSSSSSFARSAIRSREVRALTSRKTVVAFAKRSRYTVCENQKTFSSCSSVCPSPSPRITMIWDTTIHDNCMTFEEIWDDFSLNLVEHIGDLEGGRCASGLAASAHFFVSFTMKNSFEMRCIFPGNNDGYLSLFFEIFAEFFAWVDLPEPSVPSRDDETTGGNQKCEKN